MYKFVQISQIGVYVGDGLSVKRHAVGNACGLVMGMGPTGVSNCMWTGHVRKCGGCVCRS